MKHIDVSEFVRPEHRAMDAPRERPLRLWPRIVAGLVLSALLVAGCGGWAAWAMLEGAVVAVGTVKVDQNLKEVQHRDGGIVKTLSVRQGDQVREGQVLATLDDVQIKAEHLIVRAQLVEALGRRARLVAERDNLTSVEFPDDMQALFPSTAGSVIHGEARLFAGNKLARDSQKEQLKLSIAQTGEEIRGMAARLAAKEEEGRLVGAEREKLQSLFERKIVEYQRVYTAQRDYARIMGEQGEIHASIARAKVRTSEIRVQIIAVDQNASTEAQKDLRTVEARIAELQERKLAVEDRLSRTEIRSPASGYINELFAYTVGGVITPAAKIATVVPENADLKFEIRISPADIDQVRVGQPARIRLSAFNRTTTPELKGKVAMVSPASARDPSNGQEHYIAHVRLLPAEEDLIQQKGLKLVPGMPAEVFVSTQERTAASYLAKPVTDQMTRAFRER
ncbi:HlyD family type I secretion periplasmic adaptor subunit [Bradyrhizobium sp. CCGB20]|uniref:HlyD family type I secretion periplasmic adaptor subunit n=1 Tax=Bradyrhizobium sp. CCGB20 TaxID=2949633 RepID=UPI0020B3CEE5|nr:HlyD family type I secretion periplasmic adaptor subunit [Bradyrhizobium sp. CCGB20]MCP3402775.1 HlyD family type I secretion periplasmic adaptor subunit [Bradyrhizobium sp. CCGB20]